MESRWTQKRLPRSCTSLRKRRCIRCEPVSRILAGSDLPIEIAEGPRLFEASAASLRTLGTIFKSLQKACRWKASEGDALRESNAGKTFTPTRSFPLSVLYCTIRSEGCNSPKLLIVSSVDVLQPSFFTASGNAQCTSQRRKCFRRSISLPMFVFNDYRCSLVRSNAVTERMAEQIGAA